MGQAKADTEEAKKQIDKAVMELEDIKDELVNLKDIDTADLDELGKCLRGKAFKQNKFFNALNFAEKRLDSLELDVSRVNLTGRIEKFREMRNIQKKTIDKYEKDIEELRFEVRNVRQISEALPEECFSRSRLEP